MSKDSQDTARRASNGHVSSSISSNGYQDDTSSGSWELSELEEEDANRLGIGPDRMLQFQRKKAYMRDAGYTLLLTGLYKYAKSQDDESKRLTILDGLLDIVTRRQIYTVPHRVGDTPKPDNVVHVVRLTNVLSKESQDLEIHRADMDDKQPRFYEQFQAVKPPHKKFRSDFTDAIEALSIWPDTIREHCFNATGLVQTSEHGLIFLNPSGGAITSQGLTDAYRVQFGLKHEDVLRRCRYGWNRTSNEQEQVTDFQTLLRIIDVSPGSPGYGESLLGVHGFSPMSQKSETGGVHLIIHGETGSFKSATSRLPFQGYTGVSGREEVSTVLLAEGQTTTLALEQTEFFLSGMFVHADDALKGKSVNEKEIHKFWVQMSARSRHSAEKTPADRSTWNSGRLGFGVSVYPRGSSVVTVEILTGVEKHVSDLARYATISLSREYVNQELLTELQEPGNAAAMNRITPLYIQWLLSHMDELLATVQEREAYYNDLGLHVRMPTSYAKLELGIDALLQFGVSIGAISQDEREARLILCRENLIEQAKKQNNLMGIEQGTSQTSDTLSTFYDLLLQAHREGKLYATDPTYRELLNVRSLQSPRCVDDLGETPEVWGWKFNRTQNDYERSSGSQESGVLKADGDKITLHLYADTFKKVVYPLLVKLGLSQDIPLPGCEELIGKLITSGKMKRTNPIRLHGKKIDESGQRVNGKTTYVLDMSSQDESQEPNETSGQEQEPEQVKEIKATADGSNIVAIHPIDTYSQESMSQEQVTGTPEHITEYETVHF
jgi:hypothetical protein